ncbi:ankyrin repeat domain-containing protein [Cysteiniphilum marinum]|uniref:ankyrin repeat domain-containing protein n=1 Tax=Cysteiniphilum marinum TaxID=2774191 RepID=UPI00193B0EF6|nr:ankyrin repeat domain-containing protein [Cysteiniphilum marinum]
MLVVDVYKLIDNKEYGHLLIYLKCGFNYSLFHVNGDDLKSFGDEQSPLFSTSLFGNCSSLDKYKQVNTINNKGYSPLSWAVLNNQLSTVIALLEKGADISIRNYKNENLLHIACKFQSYDVLIYLLRILPKGMLLEKNSRGFTPFLLACGSGNIRIIRYLMGILDVNSLLQINIYNASSLHWLAYHCKDDDIQYINLIADLIKLTQHRKDFNKMLDENAVGFTPVDWLDKNKSYLTIESLNKLKRK